MFSGHCLCGAVRFEIHGALGPFAYCHCESCRRASGTAFAANAPARADEVSWLAGRDSIAEYESSPGKWRAFCRRCGSPIYARTATRPGELDVRLGLVDQDPGRRARAHFNVGEKAAWFPITDELPRHRGDTEDAVALATSVRRLAAEAALELDHLNLFVADVGRSRAFYEPLLAPFGYRVNRDYAEVAVGLGAADHAVLALVRCHEPVQPIHVALRLASREQVDAFYSAACSLGARPNGAPGLRPHYHASYYAAFVLDPDGHNLEAVCHHAEGA